MTVVLGDLWDILGDMVMPAAKLDRLGDSRKQAQPKNLC